MRQYVTDGGFRGQEHLQQYLLQATSQFFGAGGSRSTDMLSSMMSNLLGNGEQKGEAPAAILIKQLPRPPEPTTRREEPALQNEADQLMDDEMD